jgi:sodium/potassium/calcium exchanger 6
MTECKFSNIPKNITEACTFVLENCDYEYLNLYSLNFCHLDGNFYYILPIMTVILLISFYLLSDTTNKFLSPALTYLSDKMNMSQNLAGVTFLALGNGAPDVIASIVASDDSQGIEFSVGALIGAGVFITCIVFSTVVLFNKNSEPIEVNGKPFIRDIILYIVALGALLVFSFGGSISLLEASIFFSLYIM